MSPTRILVVEDDGDINDLVSAYLADHGFHVSSATRAADAEAILASQDVDLIVLDINLPGEDGFSFCVRLRRSSRIPVIFLTSRAEELDRILGLELGADDYLSKPFNPRELVARIKAVLRRHRGGDKPTRALRFSGWRLDLVTRELRDPAGALVSLTSSEYDLLVHFCKHANRVTSRAELLSGSTSTGSRRSIDILISRLRRKMTGENGSTLIKTVRSIGYILSSEVREEHDEA